MSYLPQDSAVQQQALQVCSLALPLTITASATSSSVVVTVENPSLLFVKTQGTSRITQADGAGSTAELSAITYTSASDSAGTFNVLVRINETVSKVICATLYSRTSAAVIKNATLVSAPATGITSSNSSIALDVLSGVNLTTTNFDGVLVVQYEPLS